MAKDTASLVRGRAEILANRFMVFSVLSVSNAPCTHRTVVISHLLGVHCGPSVLYAVLVGCFCATNKTQGLTLKQQTFMTSQFLGVRSPNAAWLGPLAVGVS